MLKLKLQYFDHPMGRANSLKKPLILGKIEGRRRREQHRMGWLDSITISMDMSLSKFREMVKDRGAWCAADHGVAESDMTEQPNNSNNKNHPENVLRPRVLLPSAWTEFLDMQRRMQHFEHYFLQPRNLHS